MMSYQSGSITSVAELLSAIRSFAVANGWSLTGDVLSKGTAYIRLTTPTANEIRIEAARNGVFAAPDLCPRYSRIAFTTWPASAFYHLAAFDNPDTVWVTINYDTTDHAHLGFGSVQKYGSWDGGTWFHAQHTSMTTSSDNNVASSVDGYGLPYWYNSGSECALFWSQRDGIAWDNTAVNGKASHIHCELRGYVWDSALDAPASNNKTELACVQCPSVLGPIHKYNPNAFNGQTVLTPYELFLQNTDGHMMAIGHIGHLRWLKLTNYNPGDILEIGSARWKVYPWHRINMVNPNGRFATYSDGTQSTGLLGVAVAYDGP